MKKKVLIIENDLSIQHVVTYILESEGYEVIGTTLVKATALSHYQVDLILLDEWINKKKSHMLCHDIKEIEHMKNVPVIIFSTAIDIIDIAKKCGADGFIQKPFDIGILLAEIKKHLPLNRKPYFA